VGALGLAWADASLKSLTVTFDDVLIVLDPTLVEGRPEPLLQVRCLGHLGLQLVGMWDENFVDHAVVHDHHPFATDCIRDIRRRHTAAGVVPGGTGTPDRNLDDVSTLEITMQDNMVILIVAAAFEVSVLDA
jgi:hypothetical protein